MKNPDFAKKLVETCSTRSCNQRGVNGLRNAASRVSVPDSGQSEFFITLLDFRKVRVTVNTGLTRRCSGHFALLASLARSCR
jgi:hypothetical protein